MVTSSDPHRVWLDVLKSSQSSPAPPNRPMPTPDRYARTLRPVSGARAPMMNVAPPAPSGGPPPALGALRAAARMSMFLVATSTLAAVAVVNAPGIAQAATNWDIGLAAPLDDGVKMGLPNVRDESREVWKALDQEAFEVAVGLLSREIGKLRRSFTVIAGAVDEIGSITRAYWIAMGTLAMAVLATLTVIKLAKLMPHTRVLAVLQEAMLGKLALGTTAGTLGLLSTFLSFSGTKMANEAKKWHQLQYVTPTGALKIDFKNAAIKTAGLPSYHKADRSDRLPPGSESFQWVGPKKELPELP
ncbi:hypothetical protein [Nonomuraea roseola]|uniref:Uncharacterized protein n=1 Tax=Nonomuraea roseola TaxID=46179 RepID=A0ABV5PQJ2_9ACTN